MKTRASLLVVCGCLFGCASVGQVKTDFDPTANFSSFVTYAFIAPEALNEKDILNNSLIRTRIETLVDQNLQSKGLSKVAEDQNPSLVVRYWLGIKDKQDMQYLGGSYGSYGYGSYSNGRWAPMYDQYVTYDYQEGTLIVDLIDPVSKNLVWRAYLQQTLADKDTNYKRAQVNLQKAFQNYPPRMKSTQSQQK